MPYSNYPWVGIHLYDVVMSLMDGPFRKGYHLFCGNVYSSPKVCTDLFQRGFYLTGTIRENRIGFPKISGTHFQSRQSGGPQGGFVRGKQCL